MGKIHCAVSSVDRHANFFFSLSLLSLHLHLCCLLHHFSVRIYVHISVFITLLFYLSSDGYDGYPTFFKSYFLLPLTFMYNAFSVILCASSLSNLNAPVLFFLQQFLLLILCLWWHLLFAMKSLSSRFGQLIRKNEFSNIMFICIQLLNKLS